MSIVVSLVLFLVGICVLLLIERKTQRREADFKKHQQKLMNDIQEKFERDFSRFYK